MPRLPFSREHTRSLPVSPGVYVFYDERGRPVYVGKGADLRSRVRSYFTRSGDSRLVHRLLEDNAQAMDFVVTGSEKEALILENSLIKKHAPRFNVKLRDDKTYFSLRLDPEEPWPMLRVVRRRRRDNAWYFGPYPSAQACRRTIQYLSAVFPLRTCPDQVLNNRSRPCISYEIGRCTAPCVGYVDRREYMRLVERLVRFLKGRDREVLEELEGEMHQAAERLEFERAAELRDRLAHIRRTLESPKVSRRGGPDRDVIGLYEAREETVAGVLHVRDGHLTASATFHLRPPDAPPHLLGSLLGQFYGPHRTPPPEILLPVECVDAPLHRAVLQDLRGGAVRLHVPRKGEGLRLIHLARHNAELAAGRRREAEEELSRTLAALQQRLGLRHEPRRMECYDISHLGGSQVVGARAAFSGGRPEKALYRQYNLREVRRNDDFAAMEEVLRRRLGRGLREGDLPDLLVIDGGAAQLRRVMGVLRELQIDEVDAVGLAKARSPGRAGSTLAAHERVYLPDREAPVVLDPAAPETRLLQRIRDEAHRFAVTRSRRQRTTEGLRSALELVPGIGRRRAQALLHRFGSVKAVRNADPEDLAAVPGIPRSLALDLHQHLREHAPFVE